MNGYQGQIRALDRQNQAFLANQQLFDIIQENTKNPIRCIKRLGVFAKEGTRLIINSDIQIEIGKTNIYEIDQIEITSIKFKKHTSNQVILDFIIDF